MSNNVIKYNYVVCNESDRRVIDSNELVAARIEKLSRILNTAGHHPGSHSGSAGFTEGLNAMQVERLLSDGEEEDGAIIKESEEQAAALAEQASAQAETILEEARQQAESILEEARQQAENIKNQAEAAGRSAGYDAGYQEGLGTFSAQEAQLQEQEAALQREYEAKVNEMEPQLMSVLTDIYEHVLGIQLTEQKEVIVHLLQNTLNSMEAVKEYLVHVSREDFPYVSMRKKELLSSVASNSNLEVVEDALLSQGQCMIETGGGIFDCSLETELEGLKKELRLLSYEKAVGI